MRSPLIRNLSLALCGFATAVAFLLLTQIVLEMVQAGFFIAPSFYWGGGVLQVIPLPAVIYTIVCLVVGILYRYTRVRNGRAMVQANRLYLLIFTGLMLVLAVPVALMNPIVGGDAQTLPNILMTGLILFFEFSTSLSAFLLWNLLLTPSTVMQLTQPTESATP